MRTGTVSVPFAPNTKSDKCIVNLYLFSRGAGGSSLTEVKTRKYIAQSRDSWPREGRAGCAVSSAGLGGPPGGSEAKAGS